jgi:hypothetical protein
MGMKKNPQPVASTAETQRVPLMPVAWALLHRSMSLQPYGRRMLKLKWKGVSKYRKVVTGTDAHTNTTTIEQAGD